MRRWIVVLLAVLVFTSLISSSYASEKLFDNKFDALKVDPDEEYWKVIFTFGPGGDSEIPYLLQFINHENRNVRFNSLLMLEKWFLASDAKTQLVEQYWKEEDSTIKLLILSGLEVLISNYNERKQFFDLVVKKETDPQVRKFAQESLDLIDTLPKMIDGSKRELDLKKFKEEYRILYESCGTEGNYEKLRKYSSVEREKDLKLLKIRILERNSDEALDDCDKISDIIVQNRFIKENPNSK